MAMVFDPIQNMWVDDGQAINHAFGSNEGSYYAPAPVAQQSPAQLAPPSYRQQPTCVPCVQICTLVDQPTSSSLAQSSNLLGRFTYITGNGSSTAWENTCRISPTPAWLLGVELVLATTAPASYYVLIFDTVAAGAVANGTLALHTYGPVAAGGTALYTSGELVDLGSLAPFYGDPFDFGIVAQLSSTPRVMTSVVGDYLAIYARCRVKP